MTSTNNNSPRRVIRKKTAPKDDLLIRLSSKIVGQPTAMTAIVPYVQMFESALSPEGRPSGVFLLLGPTGTGKTRTVEALAEVLHGSMKNLLRIDCGEYQMDHEVAKLIGAPPGYLGHRETHPVLTQARLAGITSEKSNLSIVLFDEIEKAAPSLTRLLLGILDKASLRLGDNNVVTFERSLIFLTSNLGARQMSEELTASFGFTPRQEIGTTRVANRLEQVAQSAAKRNFSPEFMNRVDTIITYQPLSEAALQEIVDLQIDELQRHINTRLGTRAFDLVVPSESRAFLLRKGTSKEYGAREIRRTIQRYLTQPIAMMVAEGRIEPGTAIRAHAAGDKLELVAA